MVEPLNEARGQLSAIKDANYILVGAPVTPGYADYASAVAAASGHPWLRMI